MDLFSSLKSVIKFGITDVNGALTKYMTQSKFYCRTKFIPNAIGDHRCKVIFQISLPSLPKVGQNRATIHFKLNFNGHKSTANFSIPKV